MPLYNFNSNDLPLKVHFEAKKLVFLKVKGELTDVGGKICFDSNNLNESLFDLKFKALSINTSNQKRNIHLKAKEFFNTKNYGNITFKSVAIRKSILGYYVIGELKIKKITEKVKIEFQESSDNTIYGLYKFDRKVFDLGTKISSFLIGNLILVEFSLKY